MKRAEFKDEKGKWVPIDLLSPTADPVQTAFNHCKQFSLSTRVVEIDDKKEEKIVNEFRCQRKNRFRKV